ncbi:MAG TPA: acyl-CoA dehydrogenase family protein [Acidimicrobiales bacterium]
MTDTVTTDDTEIESVESFRQRARTWIRANLGPATGRGFGGMSDEEELAEMDRQRKLQRQLFDAGFAGICVPKEYGGQGLTPAHNDAFNAEISGFDYPSMLQVPNMTPCMAVILEFGSHEQKMKHVPPILKGEHYWIQYLSEPSSGSDAAGAQTMATRDGDEWLLNGSKIWSSGAWRADYGLTLARTNADVPKHRGLGVFLVPAHAPGIEMHRIEMLSGGNEFCQEFFTDVRIPESERLGDVDDGWTIGIRWLYFERSFALSPYLIRPSGGGEAFATPDGALVRLARKAGRLDDPVARDMIGEVRADSLVAGFAQRRIGQGMRTGYLTDQGAALSRLLSGVNATRSSTVAFDIAGPSAVAWEDDDGDIGGRGIGFLSRQAAQIGGGTTEMARNVISERVLGMPRERDNSRDLPFREVPKGPSNR